MNKRIMSLFTMLKHARDNQDFYKDWTIEQEEIYQFLLNNYINKMSIKQKVL